MNIQNLFASGNKPKMSNLARYGFAPTTLAALNQFVTQAPEHELYQANPRHWADRLGLDERAALEMIVAGVKEGLFSLAWQTTCPICRYYNRSATTLTGVTGLHHCEQCDHDYAAHLDDEIVVTVSVTENLRRLSPAGREDATFRVLVDARHGRVPALALINLPLFRELITDQTLPEGQSLGVKQLTIFFSDLRGSTAFYHKFGDAEAYRLVCEHFKIVFAATRQCNGTAVKTLGDGVMGVFGNTPDALRAIAETLTGLADLNDRAGLTGEDRLTLKVGLHRGPCIVVTLNGRLDYFGETVNIAARLSALAGGNDVILTQALLADADTGALVESLGEVLPLSANLKGLPDQFALHRLIPRIPFPESQPAQGVASSS